MELMQMGDMSSLQSAGAMIPGMMPGGMPGMMAGGMPGMMPGNMQGGMPGAMQGGMQGGMPGAMQGGMQGGMPGNMPGAMQGGMPVMMPGGMPGGMQGAMQGAMQDGMQGAMQSGMQGAAMSGGMQGAIHDGMQDDMQRAMQGGMQSGMQDDMQRAMQDDMQRAMQGAMQSGTQAAGGGAGPPAPAPAPAPLYDLRQHGDVYTGAGARSWLPAALGGALPRLGGDAADAVARAKKYAMEQSIKMVLMKQTLAHQQQQMASQRTQVQRQQALALMCRVYVGSISFELKEDTIRQAFLPFGPIKSINMSWDPVTQKHKGFAFVEYEIPEAAQLSLEQMNGVMLGGRNIKVVGRPSNMPQAQAVIDEIQEEAKQYNRIYVASIHPELTEDDIKNVFEAFGPITYCKLAYGASAHKHKGFGFIEYATLPAALEAIASMNLFDLGGQYLRVGRAITPPNALHGPPAPHSMPTAAAVAAAAATAKIQAMDAVAQNAVTLGLTKLSALGVPAAAALPSLAAALPLPLPLPLPAALPLPGAIPPPGVVIPPPPRDQPPPHGPSPWDRQPGGALAPGAGAAAAAAGAAAGAAEAAAAAGAAAGAQQAALQRKLLDASPDTLQQQESLSISGQSARHLVMQRLMRRRASRTLLLANMVAAHEVDEGLHHEIHEECGKWGTVERLVIYNERAEPGDAAPDQVKIFVQFHQAEEAASAAAALHGRYFGGRTVRATLYDQDLFEHGDLSG